MEANFIGTLNLNNQSDKQFIYSSQLYGTFFNVYAKIVLTPEKTRLQELRLYLVNYKGHLNLGLIKNLTESQNVEIIDGKIKFKIHVKALESINGENSYLTLLLNGIEIKGLRYMEIERELHPIEVQNDGPKALANQVFDSEFYDRDGVFYQRRSNPEDIITKSPGLRCKTSFLHLVTI